MHHTTHSFRLFFRFLPEDPDGSFPPDGLSVASADTFNSSFRLSKLVPDSLSDLKFSPSSKDSAGFLSVAMPSFVELESLFALAGDEWLPGSFTELFGWFIVSSGLGEPAC